MDGVVPKYSSQSIYECANDWVSQGNMHCAGIVQYYEAYYAKVINVLAVLSFLELVLLLVEEHMFFSIRHLY